MFILGFLFGFLPPEFSIYLIPQFVKCGIDIGHVTMIILIRDNLVHLEVQIIDAVIVGNISINTRLMCVYQTTGTGN
jgi:hypothetical protein